jgi:1,4-alpha-glucan branching enzyme
MCENHDEITGYLALVLHAHLPFVRHPEHEVHLEEHWLFEAITETYLPLLNLLETLTEGGIRPKLTMSITPPLASMLGDELLCERYNQRITSLIELAAREVERTRHEPPFDRLARMYYARFIECRRMFNEWYERDLLGAFARFQEMGVVEIMASAATHGYLPLMLPDRRAARAQIAVGVQHYEQTFGRRPRGFWLPECGYAPGLDDLLAEQGIRYTLLECHGIAYARPKPRLGLYAPVYCPSGVAAFGRDVASSKQVWSAMEGYPGDSQYREFYRDVGYDLDYDYLRPYIHPDGHRMLTGMKYYRITGPDGDKEPYLPLPAREKAREHAADFLRCRTEQAAALSRSGGRPPILVAPYDAELFGHWWYEGPDWLEFLMRDLAAQRAIRPVTLSEYLDRHPVNQQVQPCESSWGWKGYHEVWLEGGNAWIYRELHRAAGRMASLADAHPAPTEMQRRALNQAARELLLAQSSDWAFIMKTRTAVDYAVSRTRTHLERFGQLAEALTQGRVDEHRLAEIERRDNLFPDLDYRVYATSGEPSGGPNWRP